MPQLRYWDYGSDLDSLTDNFSTLALHDPGVYYGLTLTVDILSRLVLIPGWGLQPDGIVWQETTDVVIPFTPPGVPTIYTLVATHQDQARFGQVAVEYSLEIGELTSWPDGVVLGWIYYPAAPPGAPLDATMLLSAPSQMASSYTAAVVNHRPLEIVPAYPRSYYDVASSGVDTGFDPILWETVGQFLIYQRAYNSATAPGQEIVVQHLQLYADEVLRPKRVEVYCNIPADPLNNLTIQLYDTSQVLLVTQVNPSPIVWDYAYLDVPRIGGTFAVGKPYTVRLIFYLGIGQEIKAGRVKFEFWPYPV
jgi:hypothetical protein